LSGEWGKNMSIVFSMQSKSLSRSNQREEANYAELHENQVLKESSLEESSFPNLEPLMELQPDSFVPDSPAPSAFPKSFDTTEFDKYFQFGSFEVDNNPLGEQWLQLQDQSLDKGDLHSDQIVDKKEEEPNSENLESEADYYQLVLKAYHSAQDLITKSKAAVELYRCLDLGIGVERNAVLMKQMHEEAGKLLLCTIKTYFYGDGIEQYNLMDCIELCSSQLNNTEYSDYIKARVYFNFGQVYDREDSNPGRNQVNAIECFKLAAQCGDVIVKFYAYYKLFLMYRHGFIDNDGNCCKNNELSNEYFKALAFLSKTNKDCDFMRRFRRGELQDEPDLIVRDIILYILPTFQEKYFSVKNSQEPIEIELRSILDSLSIPDISNGNKVESKQEIQFCSGFEQQVKQSMQTTVSNDNKGKNENGRGKKRKLEDNNQSKKSKDADGNINKKPRLN